MGQEPVSIGHIEEEVRLAKPNGARLPVGELPFPIL